MVGGGGVLREEKFRKHTEVLSHQRPAPASWKDQPSADASLTSLLFWITVDSTGTFSSGCCQVLPGMCVNTYTNTMTWLDFPQKLPSFFAPLPHYSSEIHIAGITIPSSYPIARTVLFSQSPELRVWLHSALKLVTLSLDHFLPSDVLNHALLVFSLADWLSTLCRLSWLLLPPILQQSLGAPILDPALQLYQLLILVILSSFKILTTNTSWSLPSLYPQLSGFLWAPQSCIHLKTPPDSKS